MFQHDHGYFTAALTTTVVVAVLTVSCEKETIDSSQIDSRLSSEEGFQSDQDTEGFDKSGVIDLEQDGETVKTSENASDKNQAVSSLRNLVGNLIVAGAGRGDSAEVIGFNAQSYHEEGSFYAYSSTFKGGVHVAVGDVDGDRHADVITGAGLGGGPHIRIFDKDGNDLSSFFAFDQTSLGGVFVAACDVNGDGRDDVIAGAGYAQPPQVKVFDGLTGSQLASFFAYDETLLTGVRVACGDFDGDGEPDIVTGPGPGGTSQIRVLRLDGHVIKEFDAFPTMFAGGMYVAAGDVDGDGKSDVVVGAGEGGSPYVKVFKGSDASEIASFLAFDQAFRGGVRVAMTDSDGDEKAELVVGAGQGGSPHVKVLNATTGELITSFFAYDQSSTMGVYVGGIPRR